jgi:mono/diheme cytochrome c family protein
MRLLAVIGALGIVLAICAGIYFFGGYYSVSAAEADLPPVKWALLRVRTASIERHAIFTPSHPLDDPALVKAGAKAFAQRGCVNCHGGPGADWAKFSEGLQPDPPDLNDVAKVLSPAEIFWVIKNGINMTGMPSFGRIKVNDDEIWSIVAFVKQLPSVSPENYKAWSEAP